MKAAWMLLGMLAGAAHGQAWLRVIDLPTGSPSDPRPARAAAVGDLDGDGLADVVAAPYVATSLPATARVYSAATGAVILELTSSSITDDYVMGLEAVGDVDDDGVIDIGLLLDHPFLPESATTIQSVQVFSGADGSALLELSEADPADQFRSFCGMGDLDGDGHDDIAVGAVRGQLAGQELGYVRLFSGADGSAIATWWGQGPEWFGSVVVDIGDLDADGLHDAAVCIFDYYDPDTGYGRVQVLSGADGSVLLDLFSGSSKYWGWALEAPGDMNADLVPDLLVSDIGFTNDPGWVYLYSGANGDLLRVWAGTSSSSGLPGHNLGAAIDMLDDLDGDGVRELVVSSRDHTVDVMSGASPLRLYQFKLAALAWMQGAGLGDVDGDGYPDVGVSDPNRLAIVRLAPWGHWLSGGLGLAGLHGVPTAGGSGPLDGSGAVTLTLAQARENAPAFLVVGAGVLAKPFKGGVLVPSPTPGGLLVPLTTDADGGKSLSATWPASVPAGFVLGFQFWIADPAGPQGFAASNVVTCASL